MLEVIDVLYNKSIAIVYVPIALIDVAEHVKDLFEGNVPPLCGLLVLRFLYVGNWSEVQFPAIQPRGSYNGLLASRCLVEELTALY